MLIEIWSDVICPFCYIGKKNFEKALNRLPFKDEIRIVWRSFQLDPDLPAEGLPENTTDYLVKRKGMSKTKVEAMLHQLEQRGKEAGIRFRIDIAIPANTLRAQRLIQFAQQRGKGSAMEEALFEAHFSLGKNIGNSDVLQSLGLLVGLDEAETQKIIAGNSYHEEVQNDLKTARELGISGVPFFVIDRKYAISGAQPDDVFYQALSDLYKEMQPATQIENQTDTAKCNPESCDTGL